MLSRRLIHRMSLCAVLALTACSSQVSKHHQHADEAIDHSKHQAMLDSQHANKKYQKNQQTYRLDGLSLLRMDDRSVSLLDELPNNEAVILNFIFTSCTTICPVLSATFSQFQDNLGDKAKAVRMISISIDPEYDTPSNLREYAKKFDAGPQWRFYTGTVKQSTKVQKAFRAFRGGKINHIPLTFLRAPGTQDWVRLEGFTSSSDLMNEFELLFGS